MDILYFWNNTFIKMALISKFTHVNICYMFLFVEQTFVNFLSVSKDLLIITL